MTGFAEHAWQATAATRAAIHRHPFIAELAAGTLARERFRFYIAQDALYLARFSRALAIAGARAPDAAGLEAFAGWALGAVAVETRLHRQFLAEFGIDPAGLAAAEPAPDCRAYTDFLIATAYHEPWEVTVAALVPCFRIYWDVGCAIAGSAAPDNPYRAWIDTYADPGFGAAVEAILAVADAAAAAASAPLNARMHAAYTRATTYEYLFWDGAYRQRAWPDFA